MLKKMIVAVAIVLLVIGIGSFIINAGEKKDVKTQKEEPLCYKVASMIKDGTIDKYVPERIDMPDDPRGSEYLNLDIDGDGISDKAIVSSGEEGSFLVINLSSGGKYDMDKDGFIMLVKIKGQIYALVTYWEWDRQSDGSKVGKVVSRQLYLLTKQTAKMVCKKL